MQESSTNIRLPFASSVLEPIHLKSVLITLSLRTVIPGNWCFKTVCQLNYLQSTKIKSPSQYAVSSLTRQSRLKIIDTTRGDAASGVSLCHENTSTSVIAYAHSLRRNQITLRKMDKTQWRKLQFSNGILRIWTCGMYAHKARFLTRKIKQTLFFPLSVIWKGFYYTMFPRKKWRYRKVTCQPPDQVEGLYLS